MRSKVGILKKTLSNKAVLYVVSRYATYFVQFVNSLLIAVYLGPFYLGVWGFIQLIVMYLAQINLGIPNAVNVIVSIEKEKEKYSQTIIGNGITMLIGLSIIVTLFFIANQIFRIDIGEKFNFAEYAPFVCLIAIMGYFNTLFSNIFRIYGKITAIALNQSLFPVSMLITIFLFRENNLLWALLFANLLSVAIAFLIFLYQKPVSFKPAFNLKEINRIQKKGWFLFIYNASFYLIILTSRSFISRFYKIEEFGYFTFSYSMAHAIFLFLEALSYLVFPKMINRFAVSNNEHIIQVLEMVRNAYISVAHGLVHLVVPIFPLLLCFFPVYRSTFAVFGLTALTVVLYTNSFGYSGLLMARGKERRIAMLALSALLINIVLNILLVKYVNVPYSRVIVATMITYFIYIFILGIYGRKELNLPVSFRNVLSDIFPARLFIPFLLSTIFIVFSMSYILFVIPFSVYILLNYRSLLQVTVLIKKMISSPRFIDI